MTAALTQDNNQSDAFFDPILSYVTSMGFVGRMRLLADLCRASLTGEADDGILGSAGDEKFCELTVRARLTSPVARAFAAARRTMPPSLAESHRNARARAAISNGRVMSLARMAFPVLARAGVPAIAFKGPFQHRQLHGDPFFARSNDLDLLVAREDFARALAALEAEGFVRHQTTSAWWTTALGEVHLVHPQGGVIDLHHRLQQPGCPPPRDIAAFLRASRREGVGEVEFAFPDRHHTVLICALNFTKEFVHRHTSARYAYDVATALTAMDEGERGALAALAEAQNLTGTLGFAAMLCEVIFGLDLPLATRHRPYWAEERDPVLAMVFAPDAPETRWPRRRAILWALCSGEGAAGKTAEFAREAARMIASETLRRTARTGG